MKVEIISRPLDLVIYGIGETVLNKEYTNTVFKTSGKMWEYLKHHQIKNKGKNIWVYEQDERIFTGVELDDQTILPTGLEQKRILLQPYAYYRHTGPYSLIKKMGIDMKNEMKSKGYETTLPYIEIYGHWTGDESTTETELIMALR